MPGGRDVDRGLPAAARRPARRLHNVMRAVVVIPDSDRLSGRADRHARLEVEAGSSAARVNRILQCAAPQAAAPTARRPCRCPDRPTTLQQRRPSDRTRPAGRPSMESCSPQRRPPTARTASTHDGHKRADASAHPGAVTPSRPDHRCAPSIIASCLRALTYTMTRITNTTHPGANPQHL